MLSKRTGVGHHQTDTIFQYVDRSVSKPFERPTLTEAQQHKLASYLKEDAEYFREFSGHGLPDWQV